jgi:hypothetical protein
MMAPHGAAGFGLGTGARPRIAPAMTSIVRASSPMAAEEASSEDAAADAEKKRLRAQRLALEAEKAMLESQQLDLQVSRLKEEVAKSRPPEEVQAPPPPSVAPAAPAVEATRPAAASPAARSAVGGSNETEGGLLGFLNISESELPPQSLSPGLTQLLAGRSEEDVQLSDAQVEAAKASVFDLESFYVSSVEQTFIGTIFRGNLRTNASAAYERVSAAARACPALSDVKFVLLKEPMAPALEEMEVTSPPPAHRAYLAWPT